MGKGNKRFRNGIDLKQRQQQMAKKQPPGMKGFKVQEQKIYFDEYIQSPPPQERYGKPIELKDPQKWQIKYDESSGFAGGGFAGGFVQLGPGNRTLNIHPAKFPPPFNKFTFIEVKIDLNQKLILVAYSYPGINGRQVQWTVMPDTTEAGIRSALHEAGRNLYELVKPHA